MWNGFPTVSGNRGAGRDMRTRRACRAWSGKDPQDPAPAGSQDRLREGQGACGKLSSAHSLDPCWFQDQANESEGAAGVLPEDLGRDSGGVGRGVGGWRGRLFIHQTGCCVQNSVLTRQAFPSGLRPQQR